MPVSGNEETGVKPMVRKSSDYIAGVPIKKRRFPIFRPPSPPPEVPSVENDSLQKDPSSPSQGSALSNASVATSSCLSDMNKNSESEVRRGSSDVVNDYVVQSNVNYTKVKVEEPSISVHPGSLDDVNSKDKLLMAENEVRRIISVKKELSLASTESLALNIGNRLPTNQNTEVKNASEVSSLPENSASLFQLKEHLPALAGQCSDSRFQNQGTLESISLNLSLSKETSNIKGKNDGDGSSNSSALLHANRANWDLNTTMDAWEGSANDAAVGKMSVDRIDTTGGTHDIKPLICSSGMIGVDVASEKHAENLTKLAIASSLPSKQYKSDDSLDLGLSPSCPQPSIGHESSASSFKLDSNRAIPNTSLSKVEVKTSNLNAINMRAVKSEPVDESVKPDQEGANATNVGLSSSRVGKGDQCRLEALKSPSVLNKRLVDLRSIKSEPSFEGNKKTVKLVEGMPLQLKRPVVPGVDNHICAGKSACSTELTKSGDLLNNSGQFSSTNAAQNDATISQEAGGSSKQVVTSVDGKVDIVKPEDSMVEHPQKVEDPQSCKLKSTNELLDSHGNDEGSASDEEKINISADMLEDTYDSDYESDGNHALNAAVDMKQDRVEDDYEDGEVREPLEHIPAEKSMCEKGPAELIDKDDCGNKKIDSVGFSSDVDCNSSYAGGKDNKSLDINETSNKDGEQATAMALDKPETESSRPVCFQESPTVEKQPGEAVIKGLVKVAQRKPRDLLGKKDVQKSQETEPQSNQVFNESERTVVTVSQGTEVDVNRTDEVQTNGPALPKPSTSGDNTANNTSGAGQRSRIINLPRSNASPPGKTRSFPGRLSPSRTGRERDLALEGDKIHPRGRDEIYLDSTQKFSRERHQDQSHRNTRMNFQRGRGRFTSRVDTFRGDRESDHDFNSEFYNGQTGFRVRHNKYAEADLEYSPYNIAQDVHFVGTGRGGRKPLNDEGPIIHRMPSRRRSPGGGRGLHMVRRIPRHISQNRCIGEDGTELVGLRHGEKFMRGFPDDSMDPRFTRPQPSYEGVDGHFGRGNRTFSPVQRRGLPRIRSKSPINSRTRSPGQWSSPRRRSPDGFGHPGLTHRRSPPFYRMERMRSPDRPCFPGEVVVRRNDMRDMDSGRDHGHPRPVIPNRSPSGRIILRNRGFDVIESQERPDGDDYFGGPLHSGRLHELAGDGNGDDRRRFGERRGPLRPYRPPFNDADGENFHLNPEDGPRPFRFCPDDDAEFQERGNLREREFDRRIKNRPGNAPRRMRSIEEQESNYRHGGQVWHDDGFDDLSRVKRKRF
ncbi:hypothetical protein FEM48_Zijuj03G0080600 [Ziziphus jujuba var. spinosa]|uniref:Uncharacterized protein n=1 Tax=Ziziphus jujuba var. spinosa TaxID=714518 RepID=A0A978VP50_ZIZJJ|nr:hypothetical protein FEM48_Zijuj03G0080600 [Ziziphus jujuba var. spinosa]